MSRNSLAPFAILAALVLTAASSRASYIDAINGSATPGGTYSNAVYFAIPGNDIGWYYTPAFSYDLTGISTTFSQANGTVLTPTITVQIQSERPVNGGVVLAQGTFSANSGNGGLGGATFSPILLDAGQTYFVDLVNMNGMGVDLGQWQSNAPSSGATKNLGAYYEDASLATSNFSTAHIGTGYVTSSDGVNLSGAEPILNFSGSVVPEPSSIALLCVGIGFFAAARWRGLGRS